MVVRRVLVPYHNEEDKKKLEDYIKEKTGRRVDLGPIGYGGKLTLQTMDIDLMYISRTNITCAGAFPGLHFNNVGDFIEWHSRIVDMHYLEAAEKAVDSKDLIALYYQKEKEEISYICLRMSDKTGIEKCLVSSDGQAVSFANDGRKYWLLLGKASGNMLLFTKTENKYTQYRDICSDLKDLELFRKLISIYHGK